MISAWNKTSLPAIELKIELKNIYNADESDLFYQGLPKKTLHMKGEKCSGGRHSKVRLTGPTSKTQPMDQGVIRSLKAKYRRKILQRLIRAVDMKKAFPETSVLDAMQLL